MREPRISVVIAARERIDAAHAILDVLAAQRGLEPAGVEAVIVLDGAGDGAATGFHDRRVPYRLQVLSRPRAGAAAAFQAGWRAATGHDVLFLDDSVEITPATVAEHVAVHRAAARTVVLGSIRQAGRPASGIDAYESRLRAKKQRWLSGEEVASGIHDVRNVSMPRAALEAVDGFTTWLPVDADVDLGERLRAAGFRFEYRPGAEAFELGGTAFAAWRDRYHIQGRLAAGRRGHRADTAALEPVIACFHDRHLVNRLMVRAALGRRDREQRVESILLALGDAAYRAGLRRVSAAAFSALANLFYWSGVRDGLLSTSDFWRLVRSTRGFRGRPYALARDVR